LHTAGWIVVRFSYDTIRLEPERCVAQLQSMLRQDTLLAPLLIENPLIEQPDMAPDPLFALTPAPRRMKEMLSAYFASIHSKLNMKTLRQCQIQAFAALG